MTRILHKLMCLGELKATHWALWLLMLGLKLYLVDLRGSARYHLAIVPNEWLSAYLETLICAVFWSLEAQLTSFTFSLLVLFMWVLEPEY